jgi:hypothetical protein
MEFNQLRAKLKTVELEMTRTDNENYFEAVIKTSRLEDLTRILKGSFGSPAWPSKTKLSKEAEKIVDNFGGIRKGQTFYFANEGSHSIFVMLWPWQDNERITIKTGRT